MFTQDQQQKENDVVPRSKVYSNGLIICKKVTVTIAGTFGLGVLSLGKLVKSKFNSCFTSPKLILNLCEAISRVDSRDDK
ncbi:hypothetical protein L873DRAFT_1450134 [Choiromyces venosus 120613-1]|uniref:Uncharacterized protein n=1 Tax=Choiromyces venosus 120613-1 TaxID=1336337 RepID=A0A3N4K478_9PEZI|nr:hypothetical protein L873DRAFT_1450134 [Choiromyces venosus 120613-1]